MLPNFFVIGAMKSATTSLCALLSNHPDIYFSPYKEPSFFNRDDHYLGEGMGFYEAMFEGARGEKAIGEGSTQYSRAALFPQVAGRIAEHVPHGKIIYMVRHPIDRIESQYSQRLNNGQTIQPFLKDIRKHPEHYLDTSDYWTQINVYRQFFADDKILILYFDEFRKEPDSVVRQCLEFLEVDPEISIDRTESKKNPRSLHQQDTHALSMIKSVPFMNKLKLLAPKPFRQAVRRKLRKSVEHSADWDTETLQWVIDELQANTQKFLSFYGKPEDYWTLDTSRIDSQPSAEADGRS